MQVGDLIGLGWNGVWKQPFVAVIKKVHWLPVSTEGEILGYTVYIPVTGKETFITPRDVNLLSEKEYSKSDKK